MRTFFLWIDQSLTRKIGGLSSVLLTFLFVVLLYSLFKLLQISVEMREVAQVDIPLTEVIAEIEVLQLEQHILIESIRLEKVSPSAQSQQNMEGLTRKFKAFSAKMNSKIDQASQIITAGIDNEHIAEKVAEHKHALSALATFKQQHDDFQSQGETILHALLTENIEEKRWAQLETTNNQLDEMAIQLLVQIEHLTKEIAQNAEKHEREFLIVNTILGVSALFIGIYLTSYIIQSFRKRMGHIQGQIETLQASITSEQPPSERDSEASKAKGDDELADLADDIQLLMQKYERQMANRYQLEEKLIQLATTDKLTGAFNRHKWDETIEIEVEHARRGAYLSLIMFDVDFFKRINDEHGHDMGDQVLQNLSFLVKHTIRKSDMLFRLGGEEFAVILRDTEIEQGNKVAEILRNTIETFENPPLPMFTASFGVATYQIGDNIDSLLKRADLALYRAKEQGRNRVEQG